MQPDCKQINRKGVPETALPFPILLVLLPAPKAFPWGKVDAGTQWRQTDEGLGSVTTYLAVR